MVLCFFVASATAQNPLSTQESRGKQIYMLGMSKSGKDILAYIGDSSLEVPGSTMACANCHGLNGHGKPEGGIDPSNITWEALSKPYGVTHSSGRKHPPYTARALEFAITRGVDPGGNKLLNAMPRYQMSKEDLDDLVLYLKRLGTDVDPGISDDKILIGTAVPVSGPLAEMGGAVKDVISAYFSEVNSKGGVYGRRLELKFTETGEAATTRNNVERLIKDEKLFAMTGMFLAGAEREVLPLLAQSEVPLVGPLTLDPQPGAPVNRHVFYLVSGNAAQARALVSFAARKPELKERGLAVVYRHSGLNSSVLAAIKEEAQKDFSKAPHVYELTAEGFDAADFVKRVKQNEPAAVFFLGGGEELFSFMQEAEKASWYPHILLQAGAAANVFEAPSGFEGKIFLTVPTSPVDQTADGLREFRALADKYKLPQKHLAAQVTAYSSAKVLVEALKRVGKELSREKLIHALEGFYDYQTGLTPALSYGPNRRIGAMGAYVVVVDLKEKKFVSAGGWVGIN